MPIAAALLAAVALTACGAPAPPAAPQPVWRLEGLQSPESVLPSADGAVLYVSNVVGEGDARDGDGYIARVSPDGKLLERRWVEGLQAPKGLALKDGRLFVSDIDQLVEIDVASRRIVARHPVQRAEFLNDVAVAPDGRVLVADSGTGRIHALANGRTELWLEHPDLSAINGLLAEPGRLVVTTMAGRLLAVDYRTKVVTRLAEGLGEGDGVVRLPDGAYLVSEWPGRLFRVNAAGTAEVVLDMRAQETYLNDFIAAGDLLLVPNWKPGSLTAWRLEDFATPGRP